jgi:SAM-dependent methyltransferase
VNPDATAHIADPDDWDHHWDAYGEAAQTNPANRFRRRLLMNLLGRPQANSTVLDIGSGQGEFAVFLAGLYPDLAVWGVEYSESGVSRAQAAARESDVGARFVGRNLLEPVALDPEQQPARYAVCSEVLEHVADPVRLMTNARSLLAPGCRVVVTVPGGPRSAFDRHIGHHRHFTADQLRAVLHDAGYEVDRVLRAGFPFFNLYKLAVILRGRRLIADVENRVPQTVPSRLEVTVTRFFDAGLRHSCEDSAFGWQLVAIARVPAEGA